MELGPRFEAALQLALRLHQHQVRKTNPVPYFAHLMSVSALVLEHGGNEDEAIAALLHDAVEDQGGLPTLQRIATEFGPDVAAIVAGCSDSFVDSATGPKEDWRTRKENYIARLGQEGPSVRLVSCADKLHNARCLVADLRERGQEVWALFKGGRQTLWYYRGLVEAYRKYGAPPRLRDELERTVEVLCELAGPETAPTST